jgi:hypothetical protein
MKRASSITILLILTLAACGHATPPTPTLAPPTSTSIPPTLAPVPTATKVWTGGTFPVETSNLIVNYPDFLDPKEASKQADILQKAYDAYLALFGREIPYGGKKITINFDPESKDVSYAGNPIRMGTDSQIFSGRVNPPTGAYYYILVADFTVGSQTQAARYIDLNSAMMAAFADYFAYYFGHEVLQYSAADVQGWDGYRADLLNRLAAYESQKIDPYSLEWKHHTDPHYYFEGMLFRVSDKCGWGVWQKFFVLAKSSGNPGLSPQLINQLNDMRDPAAKKAFSDFVALLSQACAQDLSPMFQSWRFQLP